MFVLLDLLHDGVPLRLVGDPQVVFERLLVNDVVTEEVEVIIPNKSMYQFFSTNYSTSILIASPSYPWSMKLASCLSSLIARSHSPTASAFLFRRTVGYSTGGRGAGTKWLNPEDIPDNRTHLVIPKVSHSINCVVRCIQLTVVRRGAVLDVLSDVVAEGLDDGRDLVPLLLLVERRQDRETPALRRLSVLLWRFRLLLFHFFVHLECPVTPKPNLSHVL